jgi:hypothetical protein
MSAKPTSLKRIAGIIVEEQKNFDQMHFVPQSIQNTLRHSPRGIARRNRRDLRSV